MQMMVPSYLEFSLDKLTSEQGAFRDQCATAFGVAPLASAARPIIGQIEEQTRKNMAMFRQALSMFPPFTPLATEAPPAAPSPAAEPPPPPAQNDFEDMKRQLDELQKRLDGLVPKT
jgi:polyhydroxyalkanoate synthesis regulator protein